MACRSSPTGPSLPGSGSNASRPMPAAASRPAGSAGARCTAAVRTGSCRRQARAAGPASSESGRSFRLRGSPAVARMRRAAGSTSPGAAGATAAHPPR